LNQTVLLSAKVCVRGDSERTPGEHVMRSLQSGLELCPPFLRDSVTWEVLSLPSTFTCFNGFVGNTFPLVQVLAADSDHALCLSFAPSGHRAVYVGVHVPLGRQSRRRHRHRGHRHHRKRRDRSDREDGRESPTNGPAPAQARLQFLM